MTSPHVFSDLPRDMVTHLFQVLWTEADAGGKRHWPRWISLLTLYFLKRTCRAYHAHPLLTPLLYLSHYEYKHMKAAASLFYSSKGSGMVVDAHLVSKMRARLDREPDVFTLRRVYDLEKFRMTLEQGLDHGRGFLRKRKIWVEDVWHYMAVAVEFGRWDLVEAIPRRRIRPHQVISATPGLISTWLRAAVRSQRTDVMVNTYHWLVAYGARAEDLYDEVHAVLAYVFAKAHRPELVEALFAVAHVRIDTYFSSAIAALFGHAFYAGNVAMLAWLDARWPDVPVPLKVFGRWNTNNVEAIVQTVRWSRRRPCHREHQPNLLWARLPPRALDALLREHLLSESPPNALFASAVLHGEWACAILMKRKGWVPAHVWPDGTLVQLTSNMNWDVLRAMTGRAIDATWIDWVLGSQFWLVAVLPFLLSFLFMPHWIIEWWPAWVLGIFVSVILVLFGTPLVDNWVLARVRERIRRETAA